LGVFLHTQANPDYRAEGSYNTHHIRGYGVAGMRVYDFGWQVAERSWGAGGHSRMRLAVHATDPERLEARLGTVASEGCIRIPASLNHFLDHYGVLDAEYEVAATQGKPQRVLLADRQALAWAGRYLVVVDSHTAVRPIWPAPCARRWAGAIPRSVLAPVSARGVPTVDRAPTWGGGSAPLGQGIGAAYAGPPWPPADHRTCGTPGH
jgi:hypothetical protein